jgi:hypothetical protein
MTSRLYGQLGAGIRNADVEEPDLNQAAGAIVKDATEVLKETKVKIKEMRAAVERSRDLCRRLRLHDCVFIRILYAR